MVFGKWPLATGLPTTGRGLPFQARETLVNGDLLPVIPLKGPRTSWLRGCRPSRVDDGNYQGTAGEDDTHLLWLALLLRNNKPLQRVRRQPASVSLFSPHCLKWVGSYLLVDLFQSLESVCVSLRHH